MSSVFVSSLHMLAAKCTTGAFSNMCAVRTEVCEWLCGGCNSLLAAQARGLEFDFLQLTTLFTSLNFTLSNQSYFQLRQDVLEPFDFKLNHLSFVML